MGCEYASLVGQNTRENVQDDTSTWKTYRNEEYGFELQYPEEWKRDAYYKPSLLIYYKSEDRQCSHGVGCLYPGSISVRTVSTDILGKTNITSFSDYIGQYRKLALSESQYKMRNFILDGHSAIEFYDIAYKDPIEADLNPDFVGLIEFSPNVVIILEAEAFMEYNDYVGSVFRSSFSQLNFVN